MITVVLSVFRLLEGPHCLFCPWFLFNCLCLFPKKQDLPESGENLSGVIISVLVSIVTGLLFLIRSD